MSIRNLLSHLTILSLLATTATAHAQAVNPPSMTKLAKPIEIVTSQDIRDPDRYLDQLISKTKGDPGKRDRLQTIKGLEHEVKVKWLLGQPANPENVLVDKSPALAVVCTVVVVVVVVAVVVGYYITEAGIRRAITEMQEREVERKVCTTP